MRPASTSSLWGTGPPSIAARRGRRTSSLRSLCRRGIPPSQEGGYRPTLPPPSAPPGSGFRLPQRDQSLGAGHRVVCALGAWSADGDGGSRDGMIRRCMIVVYDSAVAEIPSAKEFAALYRRMDLPTPSRLERHARRGEVATNPEEAALVAALAERALRQMRWVLVLSGMLLALNVLSALVVESAVRWLYVTVAILAAVAIPVFLIWHRPRLLRAQLRNRKLASEVAAASSEK